jgi:inorganic triphosphatase YgiF
MRYACPWPGLQACRRRSPRDGWQACGTARRQGRRHGTDGACGSGPGLSRGAALAPAVHLQTSRRLLRLLDDAGQTLAEVSADHVSARPVGGSAASWDEIEAELVTGDPALLNAIDAQLRQVGARAATSATKLERALAGRLPAAGTARKPTLTTHSAAAEAVIGYLRDQVAAISRYDPLARRDEPDAVRQMRVAARRARSALQAFGCIIKREATRPLCGELKWLAATFGRARDSEVLLARLTAELAAVPAALVYVWARP